MIDWFISLSNTDKIALFALLIALYSAILSTILYRKGVLKLKLFYLDESYLTLTYSSESIYADKIGVQRECYNPKKYTLAIFVRIINKSKYPTTICDFILNNRYFFNSSSNVGTSLIPKSFIKKEDVLVANSYTNLEKSFLKVQPLCELKPLSATEGCLIFTELTSIPKKFKIKVRTVQKDKVFNFKFNVSNDYRTEILQ